ncbi:hypothetical protein [Sorangium sp. So ce861]|uniref:hypothetical protein n=1 Tax=Sorangium sp. So ce861 TaxID=3133323 RepID=UPI003F5FEB6F
MAIAADWRCRRAELSQLIQHFQRGPYPPSPENVTGTLNGDRKVFEALGIEDHIGGITDHRSHSVMTTREANAILGFAERFLLGKDVTTEQWDESASPPILSWSAP